MAERPAKIDRVLAQLVRAAQRWPWRVALLALLVCTGLAFHAVGRLGINTDTNALFADDLDYLANEDRFDRLFPDETDQILIVIDAPTAAKASAAGDRLEAHLAGQPALFPSVYQPMGGRFFRRHGLLYLDQAVLNDLADDLSAAQPALASLAQQPGLEGALHLVRLAFRAEAEGQDGLTAAAPLLDALAAALEHGLADGDARLDWQALMPADAAALPSNRALVQVRPILDKTALLPGRAATEAIRDAAQQLGLTPEQGYRLRLTGSVILADEEFASLEDSAPLVGLVALGLVSLILARALRRPAVILAALICLAAGLAATMGWAALAVGELNLISVAFAVMFIGLGVDFAIQYCTHVQAMHVDGTGAPDAVAHRIGRPLLVAALATAAGFFAFLPTDYQGVADLGVIAGGGIVIAFFLTLTLLPALLRIFGPGPAKIEVGLAAERAAALNAWLLRQRGPVLMLAAGLSLVALLGIARLAFDFDPLNLKDPKAEGMQTLRALMADPLNTPYGLNVAAPTAAAARATAAALQASPRVSAAVTVFDLVPQDQPAKLAVLDDLGFLLGPALSCGADLAVAKGPALQAAVAQTAAALADAQAPAARTWRALLARLTAAPVARLEALSGALQQSFAGQCRLLAEALEAGPVTLADLPPALHRAWVAPTGAHRVQIFPAPSNPSPGDLRAFADSVRQVAPTASGPPISILESGRLVIGAFVTASMLALAAIAVLLAFAMPRLSDAPRVLLALGLAILWTLGGLGLAGVPLNFANIIGLPLLLGIGVTFPIYVVHAWRRGEGALLAAPVARAVLYSTLTTLASFGSLALSSHPGTASLGVLLSLALILSLLATGLFLPAFLGQPPAD